MSKRNQPGLTKKRSASQKSIMSESGGDTFLKGNITEYATMMRKLINNQEFSDLKFLIGPNRKVIYAHRCILSARCAVFKAMLAEKSSSEEKDVPYALSDMSPSIFLAMLEFLYTNCVTLSPNTAIDVLATTLEYGLDGLRDLCVDYLVSNLSVSNACDVMQSAVTYNQNDLQEKALVFIEDNTADVFKTKSFEEISEDTLVSILRSDKLTVDEMDLCKALRQWALVNSIAKDKKINQIARDAVKQLRLSLLSPEELALVEKENESDHFIPVESFAYAWKLHALKRSDGNDKMSTFRKGTVSRDHHKYLTTDNHSD